jgi:Xaa-Pro aminopeptidase
MSYNTNLANRAVNLQCQLKKSKIDAVILSSNANIYYLSVTRGFSTELHEAFIVVTTNQAYLITDLRYTGLDREIPESIRLVYAKGGHTYFDEIRKIILNDNIKTLALEENDIRLSEYKELKKMRLVIKKLDLADFRIFKDLYELKNIMFACNKADEALNKCLVSITGNTSESDLAFVIESHLRKAGVTTSFPPIVAFGENSSVPHHSPTTRTLKKGDFILIDMGAKVNNYCSDITRTFIYGKASDMQKKMYETVLTAQQKAIDFINHGGLKAKDIDKIARDYIISQEYSSIPHSLGHGVGIEVHETPRLSPKSKDTLKPGMVFTIEPGIYISGFGGVRIEDTVVLRDNKLEVLTRFDKDLIELCT